MKKNTQKNKNKLENRERGKRNGQGKELKRLRNMEEEKEKIMNENVEANRLGEGKEANFSALGLARPEVSLCLTN